jgi:gluconate kinase
MFPRVAEPDMIAAALTPLADVQCDCTVWLENYFEAYADHQPNSRDALLSITALKDVYNSYLRCMTQSKSLQPHVDYSKFLKLWKLVS